VIKKHPVATVMVIEQSSTILILYGVIKSTKSCLNHWHYLSNYVTYVHIVKRQKWGNESEAPAYGDKTTQELMQQFLRWTTVWPQWTWAEKWGAAVPLSVGGSWVPI